MQAPAAKIPGIAADNLIGIRYSTMCRVPASDIRFNASPDWSLTKSSKTRFDEYDFASNYLVNSHFAGRDPRGSRRALRMSLVGIRDKRDKIDCVRIVVSNYYSYCYLYRRIHNREHSCVFSTQQFERDLFVISFFRDKTESNVSRGEKN